MNKIILKNSIKLILVSALFLAVFIISASSIVFSASNNEIPITWKMPIEKASSYNYFLLMRDKDKSGDWRQVGDVILPNEYIVSFKEQEQGIYSYGTNDYLTESGSYEYRIHLFDSEGNMDIADETIIPPIKINIICNETGCNKQVETQSSTSRGFGALIEARTSTETSDEKKSSDSSETNLKFKNFRVTLLDDGDRKLEWQKINEIEQDLDYLKIIRTDPDGTTRTTKINKTWHFYIDIRDSAPGEYVYEMNAYDGEDSILASADPVSIIIPDRSIKINNFIIEKTLKRKTIDSIITINNFIVEIVKTVASIPIKISNFIIEKLSSIKINNFKIEKL